MKFLQKIENHWKIGLCRARMMKNYDNVILPRDNLHAKCMQKLHPPMIVGGDREIEPQINADERRLSDLDYPSSPKKERTQYSDSLSIQRVEAPRRSAWTKQMFSYPCKSAFYRTDTRTKSTDGKVSEFI